MIRLDTQYKSVFVGLGAPPTTNPLDCVVCYIDRGKPDLDSLLPRTQVAKISGAGKTACDPPSAAAIREIDTVFVRNTDTVAASVYVAVIDAQSGAVNTPLLLVLAVGELLTYSSEEGWTVTDVNGSLKQILPSSAIPWDTPGTIGSTTPNTGAFTTLTASSVAATGAVTGLTFNKVTITQPAAGSTLTIANGKTETFNATTTFGGIDGKTFTLNNSLALSGTDGTTMTFPTTSAAIARTDTGQTFTGTHVFSSPLGIGVTPGSWDATAGSGALQVGTTATLSAILSGSTLELAHNARFDGTNWKYLTTAAASVYGQLTGQHVWYNAISGTAGNTVTFGQLAQLDTNGFLCLFGIKSNHATAGVGYATGAGGTVAQATSKATGVTLNRACGQITTNAAALAAGTRVSFVVTNSAVAATDVVAVHVASGGTANAYSADATACAGGSFTVTLMNETAGSLSEAVVINFAIIKGVAS